MNFKFLFPTFRNRFLFVRAKLKQLAQNQTFESALNLGTGEGDYDRMIAGHARMVVGCDVNEADLVHARTLNKGVMNLHYEPNDALNLSYADATFDLLVSGEVIEHVGHPERMVQEIYRVLRPGGAAIMTFPAGNFRSPTIPSTGYGSGLVIRKRRRTWSRRAPTHSGTST